MGLATGGTGSARRAFLRHQQGGAAMFSNIEERVRQRAYEIWQREGCPEGRNEENWTLAKEEIAIEANQRPDIQQNPISLDGEAASRSEPVEPYSSMAIERDMPGTLGQWTGRG